MFARGFSNALRSTATINLNVGWGEVGGNALPGNALGASYFYLSGPYTYSQIVKRAGRTCCLAGRHRGSDEVCRVSDPTNGGHFVLTTAQAETLGLLSYTGNDGSIGFGAAFRIRLPENRAVAGTYDFIGTAAMKSQRCRRVALLGNTAGASQTRISVDDLFR